MTVKPDLPSGCSLPELVNDWELDPTSNKNGHVWYSPDKTQSVAIYSHLGKVHSKISDERATGLERGEPITSVELDSGNSETTGKEENNHVFDVADTSKARNEEEALSYVLEKSINWMESNAPGSWEHPRINEAAFEAPTGFELARYYLASRETTIYYHRTGEQTGVRMGESEAPDEVTFSNYPYLVVHCWKGNGNATIALAPWLRAHDEEMEEVVDTPEGCGLDIALSKAREFVQEEMEVQTSDGFSKVGQTALTSW